VKEEVREDRDADGYLIRETRAWTESPAEMADVLWRDFRGIAWPAHLSSGATVVCVELRTEEARVAAYPGVPGREPRLETIVCGVVSVPLQQRFGALDEVAFELETSALQNGFVGAFADRFLRDANSLGLSSVSFFDGGEDEPFRTVSVGEGSGSGLDFLL